MTNVPTPDVGDDRRADLHDTASCPIGYRCENDGVESPDITVTTVSTPLGVYCVSLCPRCLSSGIAPAIALSTAVHLVDAHVRHLGITHDDMADALATEAASAPMRRVAGA